MEEVKRERLEEEYSRSLAFPSDPFPQGFGGKGFGGGGPFAKGTSPPRAKDSEEAETWRGKGTF